MIQRVKKLSFSILLALGILAAGFVLYSITSHKQDYPRYSTYDTGGEGIKALYLLTREMGYEPKRYHYSARFLEEESVIVIYRPNDVLLNEKIEQESLKAWLLRGNTLVIIPDDQNIGTLWIFQMISELKQWHEIENYNHVTVTWYGLGDGLVCVIDRPDAFLNENLKNSDASVAFIRSLERIDHRTILFNEYYHNMQRPAPGVWELIGSSGQLVAIQLMLALLLIAIRGWRPFGRVRDEQYWMKRPQNETVNALSGLYLRMNAYPLVLTNYYGYFTQKHKRFLNIPGPHQERAVQILTACEQYIQNRKGSKRELYSLVIQLEKIEQEMKKGEAKTWRAT